MMVPPSAVFLRELKGRPEKMLLCVINSMIWEQFRREGYGSKITLNVKTSQAMYDAEEYLIQAGYKVDIAWGDKISKMHISWE